MAYSDYGGYAYKNGERVLQRSDAVLGPEGIKSTPGQWPGWTLEEGRKGHSCHVIIGSGPIFLTMNKQSYWRLYEALEQVDEVPILERYCPKALAKYRDEYYFDSEKIIDEEILSFEYKDHKVELWFENTDNYYMFAKLTEPDSTIWTAFSGYGVGEGLEGCGYGFNTQEQVERLEEIFPV